MSTGDTLTGFTLHRDIAGRITAQGFDHRDTGGGAPGDAYEYDSTEGWLKALWQGIPTPESNPSSQTAQADLHLEYSVDAQGNWEDRKTNGVDETFVVNNLNQYTTHGLAYDQNGNVQADGSFHYRYDAFGQLVHVYDAADDPTSDPPLITYEHDALGRVVKRVHATEGTETYLYDGGHLSAVQDGSGDVVEQYVFGRNGVDQPLQLRLPHGDGTYDSYFYQLDARGSVVALTDDTGAVVQRYRYGPFGEVDVEVLGGGAVPNRLQYAGRPVDAITGLVDMRARQYNPGLGRFMSPDPAGNVDGLNLYAYVGNDPVNHTDPSGLAKMAIGERRTGQRSRCSRRHDQQSLE